MSFDALAWAAKQSPGSSGSKLVLLGLAECAHRKTGLAFPSLAELVEFSSLDRKSVISNLDKLEAAGFIADTGKRVGRTGQIKVYILNMERVPEAEPSQNRNDSDFSAKGSENGTRNLSEPASPTEAKASSGKRPRKRVRPPNFEIPEWVPAEPIAAFLAMRAKKKKPVDDYMAKQLFGRLKSIADAGWNLEDVINKATVNYNDGFWMPDGRDSSIRKAGGPALHEAERRKRDLANADWFDSIGRHDQAEEVRRRWATVSSGTPIGDIAKQFHHQRAGVG